MATIRPFVEGDIAQVARLHGQVFPPDGLEYEDHDTYLRDVFLRGPWPGSGPGSLVHEEAGGEITGFLGVVPIRMRLRERGIWGALCTQFCVAPERRGMTGLRLLRHHFAGPQDLSITDEANAGTLRLWRWAGGEPVLAQSLYFLRPLRPGRLALSFLRRRPALAPAAYVLDGPARLADALLCRLPQSHFRQAPPPTQGEDLDPRHMAASLPALTRGRLLAPQYQPGPLSWYLRRAAGKRREGTLRKVLVRDETGPLGWCLYYARRGGTGEVLQVVAPPDGIGRLLDHLFHDAFQQGLLALCGRVDPPLIQAYSDRYCLLSRRGPWTLIRARDPDIAGAFHRGEVFFSRLEGEWCARFN